MGNTAGAQTVRLGRGIKVLEDRVLIRRDKPLEKSRGGIIIPDQAKDAPDEGEVVAVGPGKAFPNPSFDAALDQDPFVRMPMACQVGDKVVFLKYGGSTIKHEGEELISLRETDIIAIVEKSAPVLPDDEGDSEGLPDGDLIGDFPDPDPDAPQLA